MEKKKETLLELSCEAANRGKEMIGCADGALALGDDDELPCVSPPMTKVRRKVAHSRPLLRHRVALEGMQPKGTLQVKSSSSRPTVTDPAEGLLSCY